MGRLAMTKILGLLLIGICVGVAATAIIKPAGGQLDDVGRVAVKSAFFPDGIATTLRVDREGYILARCVP